MTRAVLRISSSLDVDRQYRDLVLKCWKAKQSTYQIALGIRVHAETIGEPEPLMSIAQAYAANVIARHQDAIHAARQQEAQRA